MVDQSGEPLRDTSKLAKWTITYNSKWKNIAPKARVLPKLMFNTHFFIKGMLDIKKNKNKPKISLKYLSLKVKNHQILKW